MKTSSDASPLPCPKDQADRDYPGLGFFIWVDFILSCATLLWLLFIFR